MMGPKRAPPRRPPTKQSMTAAKQVHYLSQQQTQMTRMFQQQARDRRAYILRSIAMFAVLMLIATYSYKFYGIVAAIAVVVAGWMMGFLELVQVGIAWVVRNAAQPSYDELLRRADIMSQPVKTKETVSGENDFLAYGSSSMQGWRRTMEDAHTLLLLDKGGFFGVYDGHSGSATSRYCGEYMFQFVHQTTAFMRGQISQALYDGFIAIDKYLHSLPSFERGGCAAVVLYVDGDDLYCANAGDSRCVMCRNGSVDALSTDHKPFLPAEQMRIERAGCFVLNRRVNGMLALSRAIGDFMFKNNSQVSWEMQAVTCAPEVRVTRLNRDKDEFAVLACDGIWDMMTSEQVVEFVRPRIQQRVPLGRICEELMDACLSPQPFGLGCDNMSVIIIQFKRGPQGTQSANTNAAAAAAPASTPVPSGGATPAPAAAAAGEAAPSSPARAVPPPATEPNVDANQSAGRASPGEAKASEESKAGLSRPASPPARTTTATKIPAALAETLTLTHDSAVGSGAQNNRNTNPSSSERNGEASAGVGSGKSVRSSGSSPSKSVPSSPELPGDRSGKRKTS